MTKSNNNASAARGVDLVCIDNSEEDNTFDISSNKSLYSTEQKALPLFRQEAVKSAGPNRYPSAIKIHAPYSGATAFASGFILLILLIICTFVKVTQMVSAPGVLIHEDSTLKVYAPKDGVIKSIFVRQGQHVLKGQPLFVISEERYSNEDIALLDRASNMIKAHLSAIEQSKVLARQQSADIILSLHDQLAVNDDQSETLKKNIDFMNQIIDVDEGIFKRKKELHFEGIVPVGEQEQAQKQFFDDQQHLMSLMANQQALNRESMILRAELAQEPIKLDLKNSEYDQQEASAQVDLAKNEVQREITVEAPVSGTIESDIMFAGQNVSTRDPLVTIGPEGSVLVAQILVPSSGIGFIRPGSQVAIKYDAFPFQTFGYYMGVIKTIDHVALQPSELEDLKIPISSKEPVFNVIAKLDSQEVETYGRRTKLLSGSTFTVNLSGETRYIWQWILSPLLSVKGQSLSIT